MDRALVIFIVVGLTGCGACLYGKAIWFCRARFRVISIEEQEERRRKGLCVRCGYDLRATPERCPECGAGVADGGAPGAPRTGH